MCESGSQCMSHVRRQNNFWFMVGLWECTKLCDYECCLVDLIYVFDVIILGNDPQKCHNSGSQNKDFLILWTHPNFFIFSRVISMLVELSENIFYG